jgi:hypothetical protein
MPSLTFLPSPLNQGETAMSNGITEPNTKKLARMRVRRRKLLMTRALRRLNAQRYEMETYRLLRFTGRVWGQLKNDLVRLGANIDRYASDNFDISRQWLDKHEELHKRWPELLVACEWATNLPYEPDRKPSIKKAFDIIEAKVRFEKLQLPPSGTARSKSTRRKPLITASTAVLDVSRVDLLRGDAEEVASRLPANSVHVCVTSPPHWGSLRNYGHSGQSGMETNPQEYIDKLVSVFREVRRVLVKRGTVWLVLGDTYTPNGGVGQPDGRKLGRNTVQGTRAKKRAAVPDLEAKNLMLMPARVALAMQKDGWILRSEIVWEKLVVRPRASAIGQLARMT